MDGVQELRIELRDTQWPLEYIDHDREIVRAIAVDDSEVGRGLLQIRIDEAAEIARRVAQTREHRGLLAEIA